MSEREMCVCGHDREWHMNDAETSCQADATEIPGERTCYCPRFIPKPPPPGTMPNEGKKESLR